MSCDDGHQPDRIGYGSRTWGRLPGVRPARRNAVTYAVAQLGARMHYAVPRVLHAAGELDHFFTDICAGKGWLQVSRLIPAALQPDGLRRVASRIPRGVPNDQITAFNGFGLRYALRRREAHSTHDMLMAFLWAGQAFCRGVVRQGLGCAS